MIQATRGLDNALYMEASAGSGKTTALVDQICKLIREGKFTPDQIVAITFTRAAASELRYRVMEKLDEDKHKLGPDETAERDFIDAAFPKLPTAPFQTIDSFFFGVLNEYHSEALVPPLAVNQAANPSTQIQLVDDWNKHLQIKLSKIDSKIAKYIHLAQCYGLKQPLKMLVPMLPKMCDFYLELLNHDFTMSETCDYTNFSTLVVDSINLTKMLIRSGEGRDDKLLEHLRIVVLPCLETIENVEGDNNEFSDAIVSGSKYLSKKLGIKQNWEWVSDQIVLLNELKKFSHKVDEITAKDGKKLVVDWLEMLKSSFEEVRLSKIRHITGELLEFAREFALEHTERKRISGELGFQDILIWTLRLLKENSYVLDDLRKRYPAVLVDEFQDTSPIQFELISLLVGDLEEKRRRPNSLFVVGDPKQSIYMFRGANPAIFNQFRRTMEAHDKIIKSGQNYRTLPKMVNWVQELFNPLFKFCLDEDLQVSDLQFEAKSEVSSAIEPSIRASGAHYLKKKNSNGQLCYANLVSIAGNDIVAVTGNLAGKNYSLSLLSETDTDLVVRITPSAKDSGESYTPYKPNQLENRQCVLYFDDTDDMEQLHDLGISFAEMPVDSYEPFHEKLRKRELIELVRQIGDGHLKVRSDDSWKPSCFGDICIVARTHGDLEPLEKLFDEYDIPHSMQGHLRLFQDQVLRDIVNVLKIIVDPSRQLTLVAALKSSVFGCSDIDLFNWKNTGGTFDYLDDVSPNLADKVPRIAKIFSYLKELHELNQTENFTFILHKLVEDSKLKCALLLEHKKHAKIIRKIEILQEQAFLSLNSNTATLADFVELCESFQEDNVSVGEAVNKAGSDSNVVKLMTIHAAKGLEYPIIILHGRSPQNAKYTPLLVTKDADDTEINAYIQQDFKTEGYGEANYLESKANLAEEVRLMYVAMTRARDHLFVSLHRANAQNEAAVLDGFIKGTNKQLPSVNYLVEKFLPAQTLYGFKLANGKDTHSIERRQPKIELMDHRQWLERHRAVIKRASVPETVSASQLAPQIYAGDTTLPTSNLGENIGLSIGSAVHDLLQQALDEPASVDLEKLINLYVEKNSLTSYRDTITKMVNATLKNPVISEAKQSQHYWQEVNANCVLKNDLILNCRIDLMYMRHDGKLVVVDYKTDRIAEKETVQDVIAKYAMQLAAYALAVERSTKITVADALLLFCSRAADGKLANYSVPKLRELMGQVDNHNIEPDYLSAGEENYDGGLSE